MDDTSLRALADYLPRFEALDFVAGKWIEPGEIRPGVVHMPYTKLSETVMAFTEEAYERGWVKTDFDWGTWAGTDEAARLRDDEAVLAEATPEQLANLLTICIRQDRFVEGVLLGAFENGLILRIVRRAAAIASSEARRNG